MIVQEVARNKGFGHFALFLQGRTLYVNVEVGNKAIEWLEMYGVITAEIPSIRLTTITVP